MNVGSTCSICLCENVTLISTLVGIQRVKVVLIGTKIIHVLYVELILETLINYILYKQ